MLEFNGEHAKANFYKLKNMILEFNNEHAKASFKKIIDKITLEYNNNHAKANMKDLELKLKKALLVVSGVGLITVATGCSINQNFDKSQTPLENAVENELFNENTEVLQAAQKVDVYEQSEVVMDALESVGVSIVDEPQEQVEMDYEEFKDTVAKVTATLDENAISFTDQELTQAEMELAGDYYALKSYAADNKHNDYNDLYNKVLMTRLQECLQERGIQNLTIENIVVNNEGAYITLNVDGEVLMATSPNSEILHETLTNIKEENYDNFINDINNMMNTYMSVNDQNKITTDLTTETKVGGYLMGGACLSPVFIAALYLTVSNKKMNDKER